jgi:mono/diheme cytochrome c family protein
LEFVLNAKLNIRSLPVNHPMSKKYQFTFIIAILTLFGFLVACTAPPSTTVNTTQTSGTATESNPTAIPSPIINDVEPVMPEKAQAVYDQSCKSCHGPDGHGINAVAPDMRPAPRRSMEDWMKYLKNPKSVQPESKMPAISNLEEKDYEAIAAYLADLTQSNSPASKK